MMNCKECENEGKKKICETCQVSYENKFEYKKSDLKYYPCVLHLSNFERGDIVNALRAQAPSMRGDGPQVYRELAYKVDAAGSGCKKERD